VPPRRKVLGRDAGFGLRTYIFLTPDALEVDEVDGVNVVRTRVLLEDVLLVTFHRRLPWGLLWTLGLLLAFGAALMTLVPAGPGRLAFALLAFPVPSLLLLSAVFGVYYVTVFGRRSKARMGWRLGGGRARRVFALLVERVERAQTPPPGQPPLGA
jgi:hypothetical protein